ncbi:MAG: hypothetical protein LUD29_00475 [Clostridia bacterium]|nr:hypothetical protein [Clostridia bacterium]
MECDVKYGKTRIALPAAVYAVHGAPVDLSVFYLVIVEVILFAAVKVKLQF